MPLVCTNLWVTFSTGSLHVDVLVLARNNLQQRYVDTGRSLEDQPEAMDDR